MMSRNNWSLRNTTLGRRDSLNQAEQIAKSEQIIVNLLELPVIQRAATLFVYVNFRSEVRTVSFIKQCLQEKKNVGVPVTHVHEKRLQVIQIHDLEKDLHKGYCGIPEPIAVLQQTMEIEPSTIDVAIVPGSVFDRQGGRLGYGGGYYDRFLAEAAPRAKRIALAYELQLVDTIKLQPHDQLMDWVITEKNSYPIRRG